MKLHKKILKPQPGTKEILTKQLISCYTGSACVRTALHVLRTPTNVYFNVFVWRGSAGLFEMEQACAYAKCLD